MFLGGSKSRSRISLRIVIAICLFVLIVFINELRPEASAASYKYIWGTSGTSLLSSNWGLPWPTYFYEISQMYRPEQDEEICSVSHQIYRSGPPIGSVSLRVQAGGPTNPPVLASVEKLASEIPGFDDGSYTDFTLQDCITLSAGTSYWFVWSRSPLNYSGYQSKYRMSNEYNNSSYWYFLDCCGGWREDAGREWSIRLYGRANSPPQPPSDLFQVRGDGLSQIAEGMTTMDKTAVFSARLSDPDGDDVKLEIELRTIGEPFTGNDDGGILRSDPVSSTARASIVRSEMSNSGYHWRARAVDINGSVGEWREFGSSGNKDFEVRLVPFYTQVASDYPSRAETAAWSQLLYGSGYYEDCLTADGSSPKSTIGRCGCAITSFVMISHFYGIGTNESGEEIDPNTINEWLKNNNGYRDGGAVDWVMATRYLGRAGESGVYGNLRFAGRYEPITDNYSKADDRLEGGHPLIVKKDSLGHFFVVDGKVRESAGTTYAVKDPRWYGTTKLNQEKNIAANIQAYDNNFDSARFLEYSAEPRLLSSAVEFELASPAELLITDPLGRKLGYDPSAGRRYDEIPEADYSKEGPIFSSDDPVDPSAIHLKKVVHISDVVPGEYEIRVIGTGSGEYKLTGSGYDSVGQVKRQTTSGTIRDGSVVVYQTALEAGANDEIAINPMDTTAPTTTAIVDGEVGKNEWFISDAKVTLGADDGDGTGVLKTEYSLDGGGVWMVYDEPISFSNEGKHRLLYRSHDLIGNRESDKELWIRIDKNPPEAELFFDLDNGKIIVVGKDAQSDEPILSSETRGSSKRSIIYKIEDRAGHFTELTVLIPISGRYIASAIIRSISYNGEEPIMAQDNMVNYVLHLDKKGSLRSLIEHLVLRDRLIIFGKYDNRTNETTITISEKDGPKRRESHSGLNIVELETLAGTINWKLR